MERLTIEELIEHCDRQMNRLPSGSKFYQEHESVRAYLQILRHYIAAGLMPERVAELAQAEKDGRLVVFPCKVGDFLYEVDQPEYGVITCKVLSLDYLNGPAFHVPGNDIGRFWSVGVEVICGHGKGSSYNFEAEDFGKTVFLIRQEAEEMLRKVAGYGGCRKH